MNLPSTSVILEIFNAASEWAIENITQVLGIRKIPDLLPHGRHPKSIKIPLKGHCQTDSYSCGAIAGWSVVKYLKPKTSFKRFYEDCRPNKIYGVSTANLSSALRKHGLKVSIRAKLDYAAIKDSIEAGSPVLVTIDVGSEDEWHWVVIYGVGWNPRRIFINGLTIPGFSRATIPWTRFKRIWRPAGLGLVCSERK